MAVCRKRTQSWKKFDRTFESLGVAGCQVGTEHRLHLFGEALGRFRIVLPGGLVRPEIEFSLVYADGAAREHHLAADCETAGVIGVDARAQDVSVIFGLPARAA